MTEWRTFQTKPEGIFDVLARYYDPGLNRFLVQRFCNCFLTDLAVMCPHPLAHQGWEYRPNEDSKKHCWNIADHGFRAIRWCDLPELPDDLKELPSGPADEAAS